MRLNLARQWRSKRFDELIGQELTLRLVKNSLFKGIFAPVYLLSGARGCGKTTVGRLFAAAVNCAQLEAFQQNPQQVALPCLVCTSCTAMKEGNHPDFIEIDAASYTGVDHVRTIIEAATLLPVMGRKKIYLIDEAHMLSKAAFNAFLKILEEPPKTVIFFLATTEMHKILETVRSRCFHLFFEPLSLDKLQNHLEVVCKGEGIAHEPEALALIAQESAGCVRDALNHLERIRLLNEVATVDLVRTMLGHIDDDVLIQLFERIAQADIQAVSTWYSTMIQRYASFYVWQRIAELLTVLVWAHAGVTKETWKHKSQEIKALAQKFERTRLLEYLEWWTASEMIIIKSSAQHLIIEQLLLKMMIAPIKSVPSASSGDKSLTKELVAGEVKIQKPVVPQVQVAAPAVAIPQSKSDDRWQGFLKSIAQLNDPLLASVFQQAVFVGIHDNKVQLEFAQDFAFFKDILNDARKSWLPTLHHFFDAVVDIQFIFNAQKKTELVKNTAQSVQFTQQTAPVVAKPVQKNSGAPVKPFAARQKQFSLDRRNSSIKEIAIDVKDQQQWPKTHTLLRYFPGTVTEIKELNHE